MSLDLIKDIKIQSIPSDSKTFIFFQRESESLRDHSLQQVCSQKFQDSYPIGKARPRISSTI